MIESVVIRVESYDNAAMADDPNGATVGLLKKLILDIERQGLEELDGVRLLDENGNAVGFITVNLIDEDDFDDDEDEWDDDEDE